MSDGADFSLDIPRMEGAADRMVRAYLTAGTTAVASATKGLERRFEAATRAAVPGRLWRAWASEVHPKKGPARNPAGTVYVNGRSRSQGAIQFWTQPGAIRGKSGQYLAIPLPAAGSRGRKRDLSPGEWERANGIRLRFVYRRGRASLLVADDAVLSGRGQLARRNTDRRIKAGRASATVPIFVLLPVVKFRNAVALEPMIRASEGDLTRAFLSEVQAVT